MDILIVDDEANIRRMLRSLLEAEGYEVREAANAERGLAEIERDPPEVLLLDLVLPGMSGLEALPSIIDSAPGLPVVMMSGKATLSHAVEATRIGAFHFVEKPLSPEAMLLTIRGAMEVSRAKDLTRALREELGPEAELIGRSPALEEVREVVRRVAPTDARVLIVGESGTGKELVATAIHGLSHRARKPFVRVNSAAIPRDLVESEMFGHEAGAFTGASRRRRGRFELADGGTLFLDEVADLGSGAQAKLLRALESGVVERLGGSRAIEVDVRVVAASNRHLRRCVEEGTFREDLLFRLEVVPVHLPPLRERIEDVPLLVAHAQERLRKKNGLPPVRFDAGAMKSLRRYRWPGNVRELFNIVERVTILHARSTIGATEIGRILPSEGGTPGPFKEYPTRGPTTLRGRLDEYERSLISGALEAAGGNIAEAGRTLDTDRANLYRRMRRLGIARLPSEKGGVSK